MRNFKSLSAGDKIFYTVSTILLTIFFLLVLYPIIFTLSSSFSSGSAVSSGKVVFLPVEPSLEGYKIVFNNNDVLTGFKNSIIILVIATSINIILTMTAAYALSRDDLPGAGAIMLLFTFTMFFGGGMIPNYLLIKDLGMLDTKLALIVPGAIGVYNLIVARTFIKSNVPNELLEASQIDGCGDFTFFIRMVLPLSKAVIAVLVLFYAVGHWNVYFNAMLYLRDRNQITLPMVLKEILIANQIDPSTVSDPELQMKIAQTADVIKYALIVVTMLPIVMIYPFIQKYFVKGVMIGAVKG